jgi:hypothetical protein
MNCVAEMIGTLLPLKSGLWACFNKTDREKGVIG